MEIDFDKLPKEGFPVRIEIDFGDEKRITKGTLVAIEREVIESSDENYRYFTGGKNFAYIINLPERGWSTNS